MIARLAGIPVAVVVLLGTLLLPPLPPSVDLLLVVPSATEAELKQAYRQQALHWQNRLQSGWRVLDIVSKK